MFPANEIRAYLLAGAASSDRGVGHLWARRSLAGSRYVTRARAGTTLAESYAIVAARMLLLVALQGCQQSPARPDVQETQSPYLATIPKGSAFYGVKPAVSQLFNTRNEDQEVAA